MKFLIAGGAGFIGSHLTDKLIKKGNKVIVIDNLSGGKKENLNPKARFYKIDFGSPAVAKILKKERPEIVFHYAAQINVVKSIKDPKNDARNSYLGTIQFLDGCRKVGVKRVIFASSVGVFGDSKNLPLKENEPLNPLSPYSVNKLAIEKYLNFCQHMDWLGFVCLRYANVFGPRQKSAGEGGVVAIFTDCVLKGKRPTIFGNGRQTRDFLYVDDAVTSAISAIGAAPGSIYNVGANKETNVKNLLELICLKTGKSIKPVFSSFRQGEIIRSRVDYSKIKRDLDWQPKYSLEKGIEETIGWFKNKFLIN
jgi:UDP-glucose 4-epimerase